MSLTPNIIFDLDGTLADSAPSLCKAGNLLLSELDRPPIDVETYKGFIGKGLHKQVEQLLSYTGGVPQNKLEKHFALFCDFYNADPLSATHLYEGVDNALRYLKALPSRLALCTQKMEKPARVILKGLMIEHYFDGFAFGDSLPVMKPDPAMVNFSIEGFGSGPLIYVGDSETDSLTAKNAGAKFLLFSGGYRNSSIEKLGHDAFFDHYLELGSLVNQILDDWN